MRKAFPIETNIPWFFLVLLSLVANGLFGFVLYHLGLLPYRDGNGSNDYTSPEYFITGILCQLWVTLIPYQIKGNKNITKVVDGSIYLEKRVAIIYYTIHAIGFIVFNVHAVLWHYRFI
ncbi:hypothetical protein BM526_20250 (plasmid) [Alteromonas mediterranea]|uniref:hypothetical protein n=1 Tax=Alteromonas mediterranea TaxID=314275 RepID=UPI000904532B|nr:hypothetical protein [Alteromonas mediterranea]APE04306.1 hypothetical protein BM526_20250 [Alteromonas mediterranea]